MFKLNKLIVPILAIAFATVQASDLSAQVWVGGYGPVPVVAPVVVARPVVPVILPQPTVVTAYRPVVPTVVAPVAAYSVARPAYVAPVAVVPAPVTVARYRTGYIGPGLGGYPTVYTPGQPIRNAVRYVVP